MRLTRRRWLAAGTLFAAFVLVVTTFGLAQALRYAHAPARIAIQATPVEAFDPRDEAKTRFGQLEFRGGLTLTSSDQAFGGRVPGCAAASSIAAAVPIGIADAEMVPILDAKAMTACSMSASSASNKLCASIFAAMASARGQPIAVRPDFKTFTYNKSLECLAPPPKTAPLAGSLIAATEHSLDEAGNHRSFVLKGAQVARFSVKRSDEFDVSDCTILPPADLLLLERRVSPLLDVAIRIRRLHLADIKEGVLVDGVPLIVADLGYQIDNMEGIAVHRNAQGETINTLVSDDYFSAIQRNLLLQFALLDE